MRMRKRSITKHILQRTCVACRQVKDKRQLIRLVRISNGGIEVDTGGRKAGRGAYLCRSPQCWRAGLKGSQLGYALRATLTQETKEQLIEFGKDLIGS